MSLNEPEPSDDEVAALASRLDEGAKDALIPFDITSALHLTDEEQSGLLGLMLMAFQYGDGHLGRGPKEDYFSPMFGFKDGSRYPPALVDIRPRDGLIWAGVADVVSSPVCRARLNDLCFEGGWGHGGARGRAAVLAYLEMGSTEVYAVEEGRRPTAVLGRVTALTRALELSQKMRDTELADQAAAAIINAAGESLSQEKREPGVLLPLIQALISVDAPEADELLALALERYGDDAFTASDVIRLQLSRAGAGEEHRRALQRAQVEVWIAHANKGDAFLKVHFLEGAVNLARDYGLTDLVDSITAEMQKVSIGDLDLKRHTYEIKLPGEAVEQFIGEFTDADSWQAAFARLSGYPPSGDAAKNREAAEEVAKGAPLFSILPMVSLGGDGLPRFTVSADDERREKRLVDYEMSSVRIYAPVMYTILIRIWEKWGPISAEELAVFLGQHRHVKPPLAAALARAFLRFFNGDSEATIFTATPRLEALVRELVLAGGLPIYRTQRARSPGQYPGLGVLLPALQKAGVDESWIRYLNGLLANPMGENARNELLHGFVDDPPETLAALVLVGVLFLTVGVSIDPPRE